MGWPGRKNVTHVSCAGGGAIRLARILPQDAKTSLNMARAKKGAVPRSTSTRSADVGPGAQSNIGGHDAATAPTNRHQAETLSDKRQRKSDENNAVWNKLGYYDIHPSHNNSKAVKEERTGRCKKHRNYGGLNEKYSLYINPSIKRVLLLQYPNRLPSETYCDAAGLKPVEVRVKPKSGIIEVDIPLSTEMHFDREKGVDFGSALRKSECLRRGGSFGLPGGLSIGPNKAIRNDEDTVPDNPPREILLEDFDESNKNGLVMNKITLGGRVVPFKDGDPMYMIATFSGNAIVQLRPQFDHLDALNEQEKSIGRTERNDGSKTREDRAEDVNMVIKDTVENENVDMYGGMNETAKLLRAIRDEPWQRLQWVDRGNSNTCEVYNDALIYKCEEDAPQLVTEMSNEQFLDSISCPRIDPISQGKRVMRTLGDEEDASDTDGASVEEDNEKDAGDSDASQGGRVYETLPNGAVQPDGIMERDIERICRIICLEPIHRRDKLEHLFHQNWRPSPLEEHLIRVFVKNLLLTMSLPGLNVPAPVQEVVVPSTHELKEGTEWRFEVAFSTKVEVKASTWIPRLLSGTAELFGTELAIKQPYTFSGTKAAIYTWHGCRLEVLGECQVEYVAEETPMISYANLHFALERTRDEASYSGKDGPRVLVVGPENAGKSTLVKFLTAYATRAGRQPVSVNLDTRESTLSVPGSLSAAAFTSILDIEEGWGSSPTNGPTPVPVKLPLVYYLGLESPEDNATVFKPIISRLALSVMNRLQDDELAKQAGCIVDTAGVISQGKNNYELLRHIVAELQVNVVVVLGSERLYSDMLRRFNQQNTSGEDMITVIKLDKSGGCVDRDETYRQQLLQAQIRQYFFGDAKNTLSPYTLQLDFSQFTVYKLADATNDSSNFLLPGDYDSLVETSKPSIFEKITTPTPQMQNALLAIVQADPNGAQENIRDASVIGFIFVTEVDEKKKKVKVLAPLSGRLPGKAMIWGRWPDGLGELVG
ncbi:MAG: hypothetical protein Q9163_002816 [Psora crenata]